MQVVRAVRCGPQDRAQNEGRTSEVLPIVRETWLAGLSFLLPLFFFFFSLKKKAVATLSKSERQFFFFFDTKKIAAGCCRIRPAPFKIPASGCAVRFSFLFCCELLQNTHHAPDVQANSLKTAGRAGCGAGGNCLASPPAPAPGALRPVPTPGATGGHMAQVPLTGKAGENG